MTRSVFLIIALAFGACYSPDISPCTLRCGASGECPAGSVCSYGLCASRKDECHDKAADASSDGDGSDDLDGVDSAQEGPARISVSITVQGRGTVSGGGLTCTAASSPCVGTVPSGTELTASAASDSELATWTGACTDRGVCVLNETGLVGARFDRSPAVQVSSGWFFSCALLRNSRVFCWGLGDAGRLGNGTGMSSSVPVHVSGLRAGVRIVQLESGGGHSCVRYEDGALSCWGENIERQINSGPDEHLTAIEIVPSGSGIEWVSAGGTFTCTVSHGGATRCWGNNASGQLGQGYVDSDDHPTPTLLDGMSFSQISCGDQHACAIDPAGIVRCWGRNDDGRLGIGDATTPIMVPTPIATSQGFLRLSAGWTSSAAITNGAVPALWRWGSGGIGDGTTIPRTTPVAASPSPSTTNVLSNVTHVTVGYRYMCAVLSSGSLKCWGWNGKGQLGNGGTTEVLGVDDATTPLGTSRVLDASSFAETTCAVREDGAVLCWGQNDAGQVGNGDASATPVLTPSELAWPN